MKKNSFIEGTFIATASVVLVKILGMLYVVPFYAIVGSKGGALYSYAYNIYLIFLSISSAGIPNAINKIISEYNALGYVEAKTRAFYLAKKYIGYFSVGAFVVLFIFAEELATLILGDLSGGNTITDVSFVIRCISFAVLVIPHLSVTKGYLQAHKYVTPSSISNLLEQIVRIFIILAGSFLALKIFDSSLTLAVGIAVSGAFFGGIVAYFYLQRKISKSKSSLNLDKELKQDKVTDKEILKKIAQYAIPFIIINLVTTIYSFTDMVLTLRTLNYLGFNATDVEFITSVISTWGSKICMIVNSIAMGMTVTLIPAIVSSYAKREWTSVNNKINKAFQMIIYISVPLTLGLSILAFPVWTLFYNVNPLGGSILRFLIFNALASNIFMIVTIILQSLNKFSAVYKSSVGGFGLNLVLVVPLILLFDYLSIGAYYGAIVATFISYNFSIFIGLREIRKEQDISYRETYKMVLKILVPSLVMVGVLFIVNNLIPFNVYSRLSAITMVLINAIIGGLIYITISFKMKIPQKIFGANELNKVIKKLTLGKFEIKS